MKRITAFFQVVTIYQRHSANPPFFIAPWDNRVRMSYSMNPQSRDYSIIRTVISPLNIYVQVRAQPTEAFNIQCGTDSFLYVWLQSPSDECYLPKQTLRCWVVPYSQNFSALDGTTYQQIGPPEVSLFRGRITRGGAVMSNCPLLEEGNVINGCQCGCWCLLLPQ